jgi:hypothetical protein
MIDRLKNRVYRGDRLVDAEGEMWSVTGEAAFPNEAHLMSLKTGRRYIGKTTNFLRSPVGWRDKEKYPDLKEWYRHEAGIA